MTTTRGGLTRTGLVSAALALVQEEGLEGLSMRALADRLEVKASSLYWHVRDRRELVELLAESILERVPATGGAGWRAGVLAAGAALRRTVSAQRDASRILLEVPDSLERSDVFGRVKAHLQSAGLQPAETREVARLVMVYVVTDQRETSEGPAPQTGTVATIAIDSGSRGVVLRRGAAGMTDLIRVPHDPKTAAPAVVRGERVVVRRLRGVGRSEIELNPGYGWRFQVQGPTWNNVLDVRGLDVREVKFDSSAAKVECFLPAPRGVVPIFVSSGVVGVSFHRTPGTAVVADVSAGAVRLKLDELSVRATTSDQHWESAEAPGATDRYEMRISSGAVQISLDATAIELPGQVAAAETKTSPAGEPSSALDILLDGVESRVQPR